MPIWLEPNSVFHVEKGSNKYYKNIGFQEKGSENLPIVGVNWNDAVAYCQWLSLKTGKNFRLPTEAQWQYAAIGGNKSKNYKFSGSNLIDDVAWHNNNIHPVGQKQANELGIYDLTGNVWEWCSDYFSDSYGAVSVTNPIGPSLGNARVTRGGSWLDTGQLCRVTNRGKCSPEDKYNTLGFRVVLIP